MCKCCDKPRSLCRCVWASCPNCGICGIHHGGCFCCCRKVARSIARELVARHKAPTDAERAIHAKNLEHLKAQAEGELLMHSLEG